MHPQTVCGSREREPGSRRWSFEDAGKQAVML
jgi:hypothetical protein